MIEISTTITTGRVSVSPQMAAVKNTVQRGFVSISVGGSVGGGTTHGPSILMETSGYILMETASDQILME